MGKKKPYTLDDLERELRDDFQRARRRLDMIERFRASGNNHHKEFISALLQDDETTARHLARKGP